MNKRFWKIALLLAVPLALFAFAAACNELSPKTLVIVPGSGGSLSSASFTVDGRYILADDSEEFYVWDVAAKRVVLKLMYQGFVPAYLGNERFIVSADDLPDKGTALPERFKFIAWPSGFTPAWLNFPPDGKTWLGVVSGAGEQEWIASWSVFGAASPKLLFPLNQKPSGSAVQSDVGMLADKKTVLVSYFREQERGQPAGAGLQLWDIETKKMRLLKLDRLMREFIFSVASTVDGRLFLFNPRLNKVVVANYKSGLKIREFSLKSFRNPVDGRYTVSISPDCSVLAGQTVGMTDVGLWDMKTGNLLRRIPAPNTSLLDFSPDSRTLASGGDDGTVKLWRIK